VVKDVLVKEGQEIKVGQTIIILESDAEETTPATVEEEPEAAPAGNGRGTEEVVEPAGEARSPGTTDEPGRPTAPETAKRPGAVDTEPPASGRGAAEDLVVGGGPAPIKEPPAVTEIDSRRSMIGSIGEVAPAAPSVRRLARELGIDIHEVPGTGPGGRISDEDVKGYTRKLISRTPGAQPGAPVVVPAGIQVPELPDFTKWGEVEREPANKVRRITAHTLSLSWANIPHVTQFDRADITELSDWRERYADKVEKAGGKLTVTAIAVKAVAGALKVFPKFNASYDARNEEIVYKKYFNIGVAVDTERGLLVPVLKNVDRKNIAGIAVELGDLAERSRNKKIKADELQGGNINISNLGGLGTTYFSPIIAWPQVAIVGVGRAAREAVYQEGGFVPRLILPLSISYDHRLIDGADASRFLRWVAEALEQPLLIALEG
jgi:pyruvate dehydrogenase E2 component (dihydrolipoamide acetyltransferase)